MNVEIQKLSWNSAYAGYAEARDALRAHPEAKYLRVASRAYFHMKKGLGILDVFLAVKKAGLNQDGEPRLAIAPSDAIKGCFKKRYSDGNDDYFYTEKKTGWGGLVSVKLPKGTFPAWPRSDRYSVQRQEISSPVPIVPPKLIPAGHLSNYFTMWEVDHWDVEPPSDPILLKRISDNLFVVLASWDTTPLERSIIRGMYK